MITDVTVRPDQRIRIDLFRALNELLEPSAMALIGLGVHDRLEDWHADARPADELDMLRQRAALMETLLRPATADQLSAEITKLCMLTEPMGGQNNDEAEAILTLQIADLAERLTDMPLIVIKQAFSLVLDQSPFFPKRADILKVAQPILDQMRIALARYRILVDYTEAQARAPLPAPRDPGWDDLTDEQKAEHDTLMLETRAALAEAAIENQRRAAAAPIAEPLPITVYIDGRWCRVARQPAQESAPVDLPPS